MKRIYNSNGNYYKIYNNDCLDQMKKIKDKSIDCIITSPPYNFDINYSDYKDNISWKKYFKTLFKILKQCNRILKDDGRLIINTQPYYSSYMPTNQLITAYLLNELKMKWKTEIIWDKNNYNASKSSFGSYLSPSSPYLKSTFEYINVYSKKNLKKKGDKENIDITKDEFFEFIKMKWNIAPENKMKKFNHPAMFPEQLVYRLLKLFTYKNDIILDPFNGVGTTTLVANRLERKYIGIDISKEYCKTAKKRIKDDNISLF